MQPRLLSGGLPVRREDFDQRIAVRLGTAHLRSPGADVGEGGGDPGPGADVAAAATSPVATVTTHSHTCSASSLHST
jgi:hypothetical protein